MKLWICSEEQGVFLKLLIRINLHLKIVLHLFKEFTECEIPLNITS